MCIRDSVNTFGIKGFVKVVPFTDDISRFEELKNILVEKNKKDVYKRQVQLMELQQKLLKQQFLRLFQ